MAELHLQRLFDGLPVHERTSVLEEAALRALTFGADVNVTLSPQRIFEAVLRRIPTNDEGFAFLASEAGAGLTSGTQPSNVAIQQDFRRLEIRDGILLTELTASCVVSGKFKCALLRSFHN